MNIAETIALIKAFGSSGSGSGASSLANLSDVEIDPSMNANQLLKYNDSAGKWENVSQVNAILTYPDPNDNRGVVFINDSEEVASSPSVLFETSSQEAYLLSNIVDSAINNGQIQMDDLPKSTFRELIFAAYRSVFFNLPLYLAIGDIFNIEASLSLDSATSDYATFVGTTFYNSKIYRITLTVYCPDTAVVATVLAKAEELMTFTEPT